MVRYWRRVAYYAVGALMRRPAEDAASACFSPLRLFDRNTQYAAEQKPVLEHNNRYQAADEQPSTSFVAAAAVLELRSASCKILARKARRAFVIVLCVRAHKRRSACDRLCALCAQTTDYERAARGGENC